VSERRDRFDPELAGLFGDDPELLELAQLVRESRPEPDLDPRFPGILRARLMDEARTALAPPHASRFRLAPGRLTAWGTLAVGAALAAAAAVAILNSQPPAPGRLAIVANVSHQQQVDPRQAITLSFNEPVDARSEQAVLGSLKIEPATQVTVTWKNPETLVVTPIHPLAANTDYQVTIPKSAVQSQSGQTLSSDVTIDFGTQPAPTPTATGSPVPALVPVVVGPAASDGLAFWGPGSAPGVSDSTAGQPTLAASPSASPSATPSASPSPTAVGATQPATASAAATPAAAPASGTVYFPQDAAPVTLSDTPSTAVAVSPNGFNVALAITQPDGSGGIVVESSDGSQANLVWPTGSTGGGAVTALAWDGNNRVVFVTPQGIYAVYVDSEEWSRLYAFPPGGSASGVVLAADGQHAFVPATDVSGQPAPTTTASSTSTATPVTSTPATAVPATPSPSSAPPSSTVTPAATYAPSAGDGWLVTLPTGGGQVPTPTQLPGSASGVVAFSGAGDEVAWVDTGGGTSTVLEAQVSDPTTITPVTGAPVGGIEELALDAHGATLAYGMDPGGIEVETASGTVLGTAPAEASSLAFSPDGTQLAFVAAGSLDVTHVQAASTSTTSPTSLCQDADQVLSQFVGDQVAHDQAGLAALTASGVPPAGTMTPSSIDRGYVISSSCSAASAAGGPTLTASARLIVDPKSTSPGQLTDETVILGQSDSGWLVTGLSVPPLRDQGSGPRVLSVTVTPPAAGSLNPESVVTVTFDSDLDASSITAGSLWLETTDGQTLPLLGPPSYDPDTREATLTVAGTLPAGTQVAVGTSISDIDGGHPPAQSLYPFGG
jgi:hypothetical protein